MRALAEIVPFAAVAVTVHLGAFALVVDGGVVGGGDGGQGQITIEGGAPGLSAMVDDWQRPPDRTEPDNPAELARPDDRLPPTPQPAPARMPELDRMARPDDRQDVPPVRSSAATAPVPATAPETPEPAPDDPPVIPSHDTDGGAALAPLARADETAEAAHRRIETPLPETTPPRALAMDEAPSVSPRPPQRPRNRADAPATRSAPSAGAPPAQRAAGRGASGSEGQSGTAESANRNDAANGSLIAQWGGQIRAAVQRRQRHPANVRTGGTVHLRLDVHADGRLLGVALRRGSGNSALDQAAIRAAQGARIPSAPQGLSGAYQFNLPIRFRG
ncbi:MAG: Gram-negative bacterial tonB protein [Rhodobacteraceae bacterium HLUCCA12]|nr:MAG: Gram-negative bacterial tonB protein [Rhodobacteraceae bacterium HLUCCA12]